MCTLRPPPTSGKPQTHCCWGLMWPSPPPGLWLTSFHLLACLLIRHSRVRADPETEGLPQEDAKAPHVTLRAVSPWRAREPQPGERRGRWPFLVMCFSFSLLHIELTKGPIKLKWSYSLHQFYFPGLAILLNKWAVFRLLVLPKQLSNNFFATKNKYLAGM